MVKLKKNQFSKRIKKLKRLKNKIDMKLKTMSWLNVEVKNNSNFYKRIKKKN